METCYGSSVLCGPHRYFGYCKLSEVAPAAVQSLGYCMSHFKFISYNVYLHVIIQSSQSRYCIKSIDTERPGRHNFPLSIVTSMPQFTNIGFDGYSGSCKGLGS